MATPPRCVPKNTFYYSSIREDGSCKITFNSAFDSGNLSQVEQNSTTHYTLHTAPDVPDSPFQTICRSWFYFSVKGVPRGLRLTFQIKRVNILYSLYRMAPKSYRPVYKVGDGPWKRLETEAKLAEDQNEKTIDVIFSYKFGKSLHSNLAPAEDGLLSQKSLSKEVDTANCEQDPVAKQTIHKDSASEEDYKDSELKDNILSQEGKEEEYDKEQEIFFAFSHPYSYKESQIQLNKLQAAYSNDPDIYFHRELLIRSPQRRKIDLLTISSHEGKLSESEPYMNIGLFPNKDQTPRAFKFGSNKPVVLLTSRVHPGETPASHSMNGALNFLLDKNDPQAKLLRQHFVFLLIPMLNPDGVYHGFYRLDIHGQNLNRYYRMPEFDKQPAAYAVRRLIQHLHADNRLFFYCDFHAHAGKKGCFLYGNSLNFSMQVETLVYSKLVGLNHPSFQFEYCNFSKKHMNARDRGEKLTKEGAGRVSVFRMCNIIHSYTLECGLHYYIPSDNILPVLPRVQQPPPQEIGGGGESMVSSNMSGGNEVPTYFTIEMYEEVGKAILISILDIFEKNPNARVKDTKYTDVQSIRTEIATNLSKLKDFEFLPYSRARCPSLGGVATKTFYNDFLKEDGPRKNNYDFMKESFPGRNASNDFVRENFHQKGSADLFKESSSPTKANDLLRESVIKKPEPPSSPENKRASSMGVSQSHGKSSKQPVETQLRSKIGELLASMTLDRNKTLAGYGGEFEDKPPKMRKVVTPKKFAIKRIELEQNSMFCASDTDINASIDEDRKKESIVLPQLWDSPVQKDKSMLFEPLPFDDSKKSFHVNLIQKIKESKNKRRLLTYRGLYGRDQQLNVTDSPKFQIESLKNNALPFINQSFITAKSIGKKQTLKPLTKSVVSRNSLSKKYSSDNEQSELD